MSRRGNDLVRRYLWMAALSASRHNPACRALYARVRAKHPHRPAIAIGHVMRKLLHLAFAVWKTGKPFDPHHYPWHAPAHLEPQVRDQKSEVRSESAETREGDVIDLWTALHHLSLRDAALDLVRTFDLQTSPATEKRNG